MVKMSPFSILKHYSVQNVTIFIGHSNLSEDRMSLEMDCLPVQWSILSLLTFFCIHDIFWKLFCIVDDKRVCDSWMYPFQIWLYFGKFIFSPRHWNVINVNWQWREKKNWCLITDYYKLIKHNYHSFYCLVSTAMNYLKGSSNQLYWSPKKDTNFPPKNFQNLRVIFS